MAIGNVASPTHTRPHEAPPHLTRPTTDVGANTMHYSHPSEAESTNDPAYPVDTRGQDRRDSRLTSEQGVPSESPASARPNHPLTPPAQNDNDFGPLLQWYERERGHSSSISSHPTSPSFALPSGASSVSANDGTQQQTWSQAYPPPIPPYAVNHTIWTHGHQGQTPYTGPPIGFLPPPALHYDTRSHAPNRHADFRYPPSHMSAMPAWATEARAIRPPYVSPYGSSQPNSWRGQNQYRGLPIGPSMVNGPPPPVNNYVVSGTNGMGDANPVVDSLPRRQSQALLFNPSLAPVPVNDADQSRQQSPSPQHLKTPDELANEERNFEEFQRTQKDIDSRSLQKQEAYRQKGEERRRSNDASMTTPSRHKKIPTAKKTPNPRVNASSRATKRKLRVQDDTDVLPTLAPIFRQASSYGTLYPFNHQQNDQSTQEKQAYWSNATLAPIQNPVAQYNNNFPGPSESAVSHMGQVSTPPYPHRPPDEYFGLSDRHPGEEPMHTTPIQAPHMELSPDLLDQPITRDYDKYKWSVKLYTIDEDKTGHQHAETWLDQQLKDLLTRHGTKWHEHITEGFIKSGDRLTFLVLHNAADPFKFGTAVSATTSFGCYGFYWYDHSEIHWSTVGADLRFGIQRLVESGEIKEVHKWQSNTKDARAKRFHKAYWLAATMSPLKRMLNGAFAHVAEHTVEVVEDDDDDFTISEQDLNNEGVELSPEESKRKWEECLAIVEGEIPETGREHIVTGCSEWSEC